MILKLPIVEDNKIIFLLFKIDKINNYFLVSLIKNKNINDNYYSESNIDSNTCVNTQTSPNNKDTDLPDKNIDLLDKNKDIFTKLKHSKNELKIHSLSELLHTRYF